MRCTASPARSGSGKSTLIKVLSGVHAPDGGEIILGGESHRALTPKQAIAHGIQVIYQDFSVFPNLTVLENLAFASEISDKRPFVSWRRMRRTAETALEKIGVSIDLDARVDSLPVAQKQLIAIARALMNDARLLVLDEPTTALTNREVARLFSVIADLTAEGVAIIFVSHKLEEVFEISQRFTIIRNGRHVITCLPEELDRASFSFYMTGREFDDERFTGGDIAADPILELDGLSVSGAFEDVSLALRPGEILGVTGLLGSGRTELALAMFGLMPHDSGRIIVDGKEAKLRGIRDAINLGMAYVPEDRLTEGLALERSIGKNITISVIDKFVSRLGTLRESQLERRGAALGRPPQDRDPDARQRRQHAVRRKPAARRDRQVARDGPARARAERADGRRRHRIEARHPPSAARARRRRPRRHHHLRRHPRDPRELQPRARHARRSHRPRSRFGRHDGRAPVRSHVEGRRRRREAMKARAALQKVLRQNEFYILLVIILLAIVIQARSGLFFSLDNIVALAGAMVVPGISRWAPTWCSSRAASTSRSRRSRPSRSTRRRACWSTGAGRAASGCRWCS